MRTICHVSDEVVKASNWRVRFVPRWYSGQQHTASSQHSYRLQCAL